MEPPLEDKKSSDKCQLCVHHGNMSDPCPPVASLPLAQNKEELIDQLKNPVDPRPLGACEHFKAKEELTHNDLADYIQGLYDFKTMIDTHDILYFKDGIYVQRGEELIFETVEKVKNPCSKTFMNEVINHIQARTFTERELFDKEPSLLTLENGILDVNTGLLNDFTPLHLSLVKLPIYFDKEAKGETMYKFIDDVCHHDFKETLIEMIAYGLLKNYRYHVFMVIHGNTDAGKTTFVNVLKAFYGEKNLSSLGLQQILDEPFMRQQLYGKLANIGDDLPSKALKNIGILTQLTGESPMTHNVKNVRNGISFTNKAKMIFLCNVVPKTKDAIDAFYNRALLVPFPNQFLKKDPKRDPRLIEKLTSREELSGLLNLCIEAIRKLEERGYVTYPYDIDQVRSYWSRSSDPYYAFIEENVVFDPEARIIKADLYNAFRDWCIERKLAVKESNVFSRDIKSYLRNVLDEKTEIEGKTVRIWKGIRLVNTEEKEEDQKKLDESL